MKKDSRLAGLRCVGQIRCSRKVQAKRSIPQQQKWLREAAAEQGMHYVGDMSEAISASQIKKRPDIQRIFDRKKHVDDFDVLLVQDLSRLTRGGPSHGLEIYFGLKTAGIKLVSVVDGLIEGDDQVQEASRRFRESRAQAKATAMVGRRGVLESQKNKRMSYSLNIPFGVDRLITDLRGNPRCRIRRISSKVTQRLSPDGTILLNTFVPDEEGFSTRYVKQVDEIEDLIPGAEGEVALINLIFKRFFVDGVRLFSITKELNTLNVKPRCGRVWDQGTVRNLVHNSLFLGYGYSNVTSRALFWMNGQSDAPVEAVTQKERYDFYRPIKDWKVTTYEKMKDFLNFDEATKARILNWQITELQRLAEKRNLPRGGDRHVESDFLLRGLLVDADDKSILHGTSAKFIHKKSCRIWRYYKHPKVDRRPCPGSRPMINADAIEPAIRGAVKDVLEGYTGLESAVKAACDEHQRVVRDRTDEKEVLMVEVQRIRDEVSYWVEQMPILGRSFVDSKVQPLLVKLADNEARVQSLEAIGVMAPAEKYAKELEDVRRYVVGNWDKFGPMQLNRILKVLVSRMEVDTKTQHVEVDLHLPSWATFHGDIERMCVENGTFECGNFDTHTE